MSLRHAPAALFLLTTLLAGCEPAQMQRMRGLGGLAFALVSLSFLVARGWQNWRKRRMKRRK